MIRMSIPVAVAAISSLVLAFLGGCASLNYGSLQTSSEVTQQFQSGSILPDHRYYYSGFAQIPDAIVAIDQSYTLRSGVWNYFEPTTDMLRNWVFRMIQVGSAPAQGSVILAPDGSRVGVWYSSLRQTSITVRGPNEVAIAAPEAPGMRGIP
jgi:hypothetical protein